MGRSTGCEQSLLLRIFTFKQNLTRARRLAIAVALCNFLRVLSNSKEDAHAKLTSTWMTATEMIEYLIIFLDSLEYSSASCEPQNERGHLTAKCIYHHLDSRGDIFP
jgi:hypothetical protein